MGRLQLFRAFPALPIFKSVRFQKHEEISNGAPIKGVTQKTKNLAFLCSAFYFTSVIFLILTEIGNIKNKPVLRSTYFLKISLADILPSTSAADAILVNSIARSIGIFDFYQVGLWNYCEGYDDEGIVHCSQPRNLWWFNPVEIILSQLLAGATISLPSKVTTILTLVRIVSHLMFAFFLVSVCTNFLCCICTPLILYSRFESYHFVTFAFVSQLLCVSATVLGTVMFAVFKGVIGSQKELNIGAELGVRMFVFMWLGTAFSVAGWIVHFYLACVSRRLEKAEKNHGAVTGTEDHVPEEKVGARKRVAFMKFGRHESVREVA